MANSNLGPGAGGRGKPASKPVDESVDESVGESVVVSATPAASVAVLGPVSLAIDGRPVDLGRGLRKLLVARLAISAPAVVPTETLLADLWYDGVELDDPSRSLHNTIWRLRQSLEAVRPGAGSLIQRSGVGYGFTADCFVDLHEFTTLVRASAENTDEAATLRCLEAALNLWAGPALLGVGDAPFVASSVADLEEQRWSTFERRCRLLLTFDRSAEAVVDLRAATRSNPLRESLWGLLAEALHDAGRTPEALEVFSQLRTRLAEQLGVSPSDRTVRLEERILRGELDLGHGRRDLRVGQGTPAPTATSVLIGRDEDLRRVEDLLVDHRLVTVAGPPGCGKTRLAMELCAGSAVPAWWVDLMTLEANDGGRLDDVARAIATAVGIVATGDATAAVIERLSVGAGLIVLDNAEHLQGVVAEICQALISRSPHARLLVTSRVMLDVPGSAVWPLEPLSLPSEGDTIEATSSSPSVALFLARAHSASPRWRPSDHEIRTVGAIARAVDGLPLGLEIAAARVRSMTVDHILEYLPLQSTRTTDNGHRSGIAPALAWSWSLLDRTSQILLDKLSVFAGPFSLDDAVAVWDVSHEDASEHIDDLVRNSLVSIVNRSGDTGAASRPYRLLATVRSLGESHLVDEGTWVTTAQRHFDRVESLALRDQISSNVDAGAELLAAVRRSPRLGCSGRAITMVLFGILRGVWAHQSLFPHSLDVVRTLVEHEPNPTSQRSEGLLGMLFLMGAAENWAPMIPLAHECIAIEEAGEHPFFGARVRQAAMQILALAYWGLGEMTSALAALDALAVEPPSGPTIPVFSGMCRARIAFDEGDPIAARGHLEGTASYLPREYTSKGTLEHAGTLVALERCWQALRLGDPDTEALIGDALNACEVAGWHNAILDCLILQAQLIARAGRTQLAEQQLLQVVADCRVVGDVRKHSRALDVLVGLAIEHNDLETARARLADADQLRHSHSIRIRPADAVLIDQMREMLRS